MKNKWPIFFENEMQSTSIFAQHMIKKGKKLPFVVTCHSQTQGRGQRHKAWVSPKGNLYLTIAMEKNILPLELIPHKTAILICEWIQSKFSLRLTIKFSSQISSESKNMINSV